jgi:hypothetical protein
MPGRLGGTLVNGKKVTKHILKLGEMIQVGDSQFRLKMGDRPVRLDTTATQPPDPLSGAPKQPGPDELESLVNTTLSHFDIGPVIGKGRKRLQSLPAGPGLGACSGQ